MITNDSSIFFREQSEIVLQQDSVQADVLNFNFVALANIDTMENWTTVDV